MGVGEDIWPEEGTGNDHIVMDCMICAAYQMLSDYPIMDSEMNRECDTCGDTTGAHGVVIRKPEGKNRSDDLDVNKKVILRGSERNVMGGPGLD